MVIDFHTHTFPDKIAERALGSLSSKSHTTPFTDGTESGLIASMEEGGVDRSVILPVATSPSQVVNINDLAIRRMKEMERAGLITFAAMHPDLPDYSAELIRIKENGIMGIKVHPVYQGADIDDIRYLRIYEKAAELGLMVVLHAGYDIGYPDEDRCSPARSLHALRELKLSGQGLCSSSFRFILAHMGGWRQWDEVLSLAPELIDAGPVLLDTAFSSGQLYPLPDGYWKRGETDLLDKEKFVRIIRAFGAKRILFGTDSPWSSQAETLAFIRSLPIENGEIEAISGKNAAGLLSLQ